MLQPVARTWQRDNHKTGTKLGTAFHSHDWRRMKCYYMSRKDRCPRCNTRNANSIHFPEREASYATSHKREASSNKRGVPAPRRAAPPPGSPISPSWCTGRHERYSVGSGLSRAAVRSVHTARHCQGLSAYFHQHSPSSGRRALSRTCQGRWYKEKGTY